MKVYFPEKDWRVVRHDLAYHDRPWTLYNASGSIWKRFKTKREAYAAIPMVLETRKAHKA